MALVLPFLPAHKMEDGLHVLLQNMLANYIPNNAKFYNYWRKTWLPLSEVILVFRRPVKTNNISENFNRHLESKIGRRKPLLFMLGNTAYYLAHSIDRSIL